MIISLECQYFWCFSLVILNQQIGSAGDEHVADAPALHCCRFVKRRLTFLVINHINDGIGSVGDEKADNILMTVTAGVVEGSETHGID